MIKVKRLSENARIPKKTNATDAGFDICSLEDILIPPLGRVLVHTGISLEIDENNVYARIAPRSGLAFKYGIDVLAGVIDAGYKGEVCIVLHNTDHECSYVVNEGDRIAQIIFERYMNIDNLMETTELSKSNRSTDGFGSSGIN